MTQYVKFISTTQIEYPPKNKGNVCNYDLDIQRLIADGYKEFIPVERPVTNRMYHIEYTNNSDNVTEVIVYDETQAEADARILNSKKQDKYNEAVTKANEYIQSGNALYEFEAGKHIEATDGNIGKFTAYALAYVTGQLQPSDTVVWNTKEDETVELTQNQVQAILIGLGQVQAEVWTVKYPAYITAINEATTASEVDVIEIDYTIGE